MLDDFIIRAVLAGIGVAAMAGPLGSLMVWKRMAFFGDAVSHSTLLGIVLGYLLGINQMVAIIAFVVVFSVLVVVLQKKNIFSSDTLLGIIAHSSLAVGLVVISFFDKININLSGFLFGDILAASYADVVYIYIGLAISFALLVFIWRPLLLSTINRELASVEGVNVELVHFKFMLLISILVALSIKIVGVLLVTSLMIIPAASARNFANTPERMAIIASIFGCMAVIMGIAFSYFADAPAGPSIISSAAFIFVTSYLGKIVLVAR